MAVKKELGVWIRNARDCPVHIRFTSMTSEKPYRVQLNRRGLSGDCVQLPVNLKEAPEFSRSVTAGLFEVIPQSEAAAIDYPAAGYQGMQSQIDADWAKPIVVTRTEETVVRRWDESIEQKPRTQVQSVGPRYMDAPGSDPARTQINQPDAVQAREIRMPDQSPEAFQNAPGDSKPLNPMNRENAVTQPAPARKPQNRNPTPQKNNG